MVTLKTGLGDIVECDYAVLGKVFPYLSIYTHSITPIEAYQIFDKEGALDRIEVTEEVPVTKDPEKPDEVTMEPTTTVYTDFVEVEGVQKSPYLGTDNANEIIIRLRKNIS